jgi:hypothetical protein
VKAIQSNDGYYFKEILIDNNKQLEYINLDTFNVSYTRLQSIQIINNPSLTNIHKRSGSLFELLNEINGTQNDYYSLETTLSNNNLGKIPKRAFE